MTLRKSILLIMVDFVCAGMMLSCQQEDRPDGNLDKDEEHGLMVAQELSNSRVQAIAEDATGQLWIATFRGLNRFFGPA